VPEMSRLVPGSRWTEAGALDDLDAAAIRALAPAATDFPLVTRLRTGETTVVGEHAILPLLQRAVDRLEADLVIVLCSGDFSLRAHVPILFPGRLLAAAVRAVYGGRRIAVLTPHAGQVRQQEDRWGRQGVEAFVLHASPYGPTDFEAVGVEARARAASAIVLDCLGYTLAMKAAVSKASGLPAVLVRSLTARIAAELVER